MIKQVRRLEELETEVRETLMLFLEIDMEIYGKVQPGTKQAFRKQGVALPDKYKEKK